MNKKVLVTGACGFIGSHLVDKLICLGYDVVATDLPGPPDYFLNKKDFKKFLNPEAAFIPADLSCEEDVKKLFLSPKMEGVQTVFHVAAIFNFFKDPVLMCNNVIGTRNVCGGFNNIQGEHKRLVLFSSGVLNSDLLRKSNYAKSKLGQEKIVGDFLVFHEGAFDAVIVRPAAVFGPRSRYGLAKIIKMLAGGQLQFFIGKNGLKASIIYVEDVVNAVIHLAGASFGRLKEITGMDIPLFDLVDNSSYSYEELIRFAEKCLKTKIIPIHFPVKLMKFITWWQEFMAGILKREPKVTMDVLDFFDADMPMDNSMAKTAGVWFKTDTMRAVEYTINWYRTMGWI